MYYQKLFLLFSLLGFIMESTLFKISHSAKYSGIFYGPMTAIYGFGVLSIELLNKYFFKKLKCSKIVKVIIEYLTLVIVLSIIEYFGGVVTKLIFDIDMWDYSDKFLCFNKYICLQISLIWGLLGVLYVNAFKKFTDKIIKVISKEETYFFLIIFLFDLFLVFITKLP